MSSKDEQTKGSGRKPDDNKLNIEFGKNYLLVIGIDEYKNGVPPLRNAVRDALSFKEVLIKKYQFQNEDTTVLLNEEATRANIIDMFDQLIHKIEPEDSLVFYFSGHGEYFKHLTKGYWLPVDAVANKRFTYLSNDEVLGLIRSLKARHVLGVVDSCFSGSLMRSNKNDNLVKRFISKPSRWLITSGQLEVVSDGSLGDNSPFAKLLISRLKNNIDDGMWVSKLGEGIREGFDYNSQTQVPDFAPLIGAGHEGGQFVFLRKGKDWEFAVEEERKTIAAEEEAKKRGTSTSQPEPPASIPEKDWAKLPLSELKSDLELLIAMDNIPKAFEILYKLISNNSYRTTILVRYGEYNGNKKKETMGIEDPRSLKTSYAQIKNAFLSIISQLTEEDLKRG